MIDIDEVATLIEELLGLDEDGALNAIIDTYDYTCFSLQFWDDQLEDYDDFMIFSEKELRDFLKSFPEHERLFAGVEL